MLCGWESVNPECWSSGVCPDGPPGSISTYVSFGEMGMCRLATVVPVVLLGSLIHAFAVDLCAEEQNVPDGFTLEKIYKVPLDREGSWVGLGIGPQGKLIASDQGNKGLYEVTIAETEDGPRVTATKIAVSVSGAQGITTFQGDLYVNCNPRGLFRITDADGDGVLDTSAHLPSGRGGGEHGPHALVPTPDGRSLFVLGGNHTRLPEYQRARLSSWNEDLLLSRQWDARGHARGILAPGGWVAQFDPEDQTYDVYCTGFRNQYDLDLNHDGEAFTFDADMEWDLGSPWYRPTRICHVVSGGEYGWRSGTGKWPDYYEDTLPPVVNIGPGSPTGVVSGRNAKFPARYQQALFALDWTFGTIYAIHMEPEGSSYRGTAEPFVTGVPLPVTDAVIGGDGAMYFATGGRGAQSFLWRLRYTGDAPTDPQPPTPDAESADARSLRRSLEVFHGVQDTHAIQAAWPHAGSSDRFLRYAARLAIESQPVDSWAERVFSDADTQRRITMAVGLARAGNPSHRTQLLQSLNELPLQSLPESQVLGALRAYALTFIRLGRPEKSEQQAIIKKLGPMFPHASSDVTRELLAVLVYLRDPEVVAKTIPMLANPKSPEIPDWTELATRSERYGGTIQKMLDNYPPVNEIAYALSLREASTGWTLQDRRTYFEFLNRAAKASGGMSYPGFLTNIRRDALMLCSNEERLALTDVTGEDFNPVIDFEVLPVKGPGKQWTLEQAMAATNRQHGYDFESGRNAFFSVSCGKCHRIAGIGGGVGPDLTSVGSKFDRKYLIQAVLDPSKNISDQYGSSTVILNDGKVLEGIVREQENGIMVYTADPDQDPDAIARSDIEEIRPSTVSQMPKDLLNSLNEKELGDLVAYVLSGGSSSHKLFKKTP